MSATRVSPAAALSTIWDPPCGANAFVTPGSGPTSCFPPNWSAYWGGDVGYYSPAICPSGFTPGCSKYASSGYQGPATVSGETAWLCVVSGYSCAPDSYTSYATAGISTRAMVQIRWKSSDLSILETHPLMPGRKFVDTPTEPIPPPTPTTPSPLPTSPVPVEDSGSGMSTAAKAGIGAGVGAAALLLCIAVIIFIRRHRSTHLHHHGPAEMQIEVGDPSPRDPFVPKPSEKSVTVMPINVATSPHSSLSPPEITPKFTPGQSPESPTPPPINPPFWHNSARSTPTQYDAPVYSELPEVNPAPTAGAPPQTASELEALRARREELDVQRLRIIQLQQIEQERSQLDQRISMLEMGNGNVNNRGSR